MKIWKRIVSAYRSLFSSNTMLFIELQGNPEVKITDSELNEKMERLLLESFDFERGDSNASNLPETSPSSSDILSTL